jgi:hypothetical protein
VYARVNTFDGSTERFEAATDYIRQLVIPASRQMPGFAGMISLVDRQTGRSMGITLWESIEALEMSEEAATFVRNQTTQSGEATLVSVQRFEVADLTIEPRP